MDQRGGNKNQLLSKKYRLWYEKLLPEYPPNRWEKHPHFYLKKKTLPTKKLYKKIYIFKNSYRRQLKGNYFLSSSTSFNKTLKTFHQHSLYDYLKGMPPITSSDLIQDPRKASSLLTLNHKTWYVVIEVINPQRYIGTLEILKKITNKFNKKGLTRIKLNIVKEWVLIREQQKHLFISPFQGYTLDQQFRDKDLSKENKENLIRALNKFVNFCEEKGFYWRDLAPRNIFYNAGKKQLVFIDFENLYKVNELTNLQRAYLDQFRKVWFADIFTSKDIERIYSGLPRISVNGRANIPSDSLERAYFKKDQIKAIDRLNFMKLTSKFEKKHKLGKCHIYGHRMGLYLSDFLSSEQEAMVYFAMDKLSKDGWVKYLYLLQQCIDWDQEGYLNAIYRHKKYIPKTNKYLDYINRNLHNKRLMKNLFGKIESNSELRMQGFIERWFLL